MRLGFEAQAAESLVLELQDLQLTIVRGTPVDFNIWLQADGYTDFSPSRQP